MSPASPTALAAATDAALAYLDRVQLPSGEFATLTGPAPDLGDAIPFTTSPYIPTFIAHALGYAADGPVVARIRRGLGDFLEAEEEDNGTWNFQGRGNWRLPADLDTTVCAAAALLTLGRRQPRSFYPLLLQVVRRTESAAGGPYYTYIGVNEDPDFPGNAPVTRELDVLVNVNVVFLCGLLGIAVPGATGFLLDRFRQGVFAERNRYYISSHFQVYTLTRAYADGEARGLAPVVPALREHLWNGLPGLETEVSAFNIACRAVGLLNLGEDASAVSPYVDALLAAQENDGGWPIWAAGAGFPREWDWSWLERWPDGPVSADRGWCWGSRALTTALAVEVFGKYRGR